MFLQFKIVSALQIMRYNLEPPKMRLVRITAEHPEYTRNYVFPSYKEGWEFITLGKVPEKMGSESMIAIHCETVLCTDGTEALVQVCAVDQKLEVIMDRLVNPSKSVKNYRTSITGISAEDLDGVTCSISNVQKNWRCEESSLEERSKELKSKYETASKLEKLMKEIYEKIAYFQNIIALLQKIKVADAAEKADKANAKNVQLQELIVEYQYCNVHGLDWCSTSQLQELYIFLGQLLTYLQEIQCC